MPPPTITTKMAPSFIEDKSLKMLNQVRFAKHQQGPSLNAYFHFQRKQSDTPEPHLQQAWFRSMKLVLDEIDTALRCVPIHFQLSFLDVGCCPGGFSSYILSKNPNAYGVGLSLPVSSGGHSFLLEKDLQPRLELHLADITTYQLGPYQYPNLRYLPSSLISYTFDLVLLDGHPLRTAEADGLAPLNNVSDRLLISQLIIGVQSVSPFGTILIKLSKPERPITARILYILDSISCELLTWKPVCMHATRPTFYAVAKGIRHTQRYAMIVHALQELWVRLTFGGPNGTTLPRRMTHQDLDSIVSREEMVAYKPRLVKLSQHLWDVQRQSLEGWYKEEGLVA